MQISTRWLCGGAIVLAVCASAAPVAAQNAADVDGGRRLFQGMCVECHGAGATGGDAPSLNRPRLTHAPDDTALANVIANGIPNTAMPRIRRFTESELRQLVAYVRSVGKLPPERVPGDARRGAALYKNLACSSCHIVAGEGGTLGPDLTEAPLRWQFMTGERTSEGFYRLREGSGLNILEACQDRKPNQKVVVLSNHATSDVRWRCAQLGADAVFDKSTEIDALVEYCVTERGRAEEASQAFVG